MDAKEQGLGRFSVEIDVRNDRDVIAAEEGRLRSSQVRLVRLKGLVDMGATRLVLPQSALEALGLPSGDDITVQYADGRRATRQSARSANVNLLGRSGVFTAIVEPGRTDAIIGAIVLEDLDFVVDCSAQRLVPRDPERIISEIE